MYLNPKLMSAQHAELTGTMEYTFQMYAIEGSYATEKKRDEHKNIIIEG